MLVLPLFATLSLLPIGEVHAAIADDATTELRVYDVNSLVALHSSSDDDESISQLLPMFEVVRHDYLDAHSWETSDDDVQGLMNTFTEIGWNDDWRIEFVPPGEVHLNASRDGHERFARLVRAYESAAFASTGVHVQRFTGPSTLPSGIVGRDALAASLRAANITPRTHALTLAPRDAASIGDTRSHTAVMGVEVEIAQSSVVHYGVAVEVLAGLQLDLRGELTRTGVRLTYTLRSTDVTSVDSVDGASCVVQYFGAEHGRIVDESKTWREPLALIGGGAIGTATIGGDEVLVLRVAANGDESDYCAIQLDPTKRTAASVDRIELGDGYVAEIVPADCLYPVRMQPLGRILNRPTIMAKFATELDSGEGQILAANLQRGESDRLDRLAGYLDHFDRMRVGGSEVAIVDADGRGIMDRYLDLELQMVEPRLRVNLEATGGALPSSLSGTFVADAGTQAVVAVGTERLEAQSQNVEVAQSASAINPVVTTRFEGVAIAVSFHRLGDGRLAYRVTGQLDVPVDRELGRANLVGGGGLDATISEHLFIDDQGVADPSGDGVWRVVFGDRTGDGAKVVLDVRAER